MSILLGRGNSTKLCLKGRQANSGIRPIGTNKDQLLHRIQSVWTFTNLQSFDKKYMSVGQKKNTFESVKIRKNFDYSRMVKNEKNGRFI
jgi:hypothetical protein